MKLWGKRWGKSQRIWGKVLTVVQYIIWPSQGRKYFIFKVYDLLLPDQQGDSLGNGSFCQAGQLQFSFWVLPTRRNETTDPLKFFSLLYTGVLALAPDQNTYAQNNVRQAFYNA